MRDSKKLFYLCLLVLPLSIYAQDSVTSSSVPSDDNVHFNNPEGYVDKNFQELTQRYLEPQVPNDFESLLGKGNKITPEMLQRIVDFVSNKVSDKVKDELVSMLKKDLSKQTIRTVPANQESTKEKTKNASLQMTDNKTFANVHTSNISPRKHIKINDMAHRPISENLGSIKSPRSNKIGLNHTKIMANSGLSAPINKRISQNIIMPGEQNKLLNVNSASSKNIKISLTYPSNVVSVQINITAQDILTGKHFLVYKGQVVAKQKKLDYNVLWKPRELPMGRYKIKTISYFMNKKGQILSTSEKYWGNNSRTEYIVLKN